MLRPDNECHLWCLHHVFLPIINRHLNSWKDAWVHHPLRTERNKTPVQLWISGIQEAWNSLGPEGEVFQVYMHKIIESVLHYLRSEDEGLTLKTSAFQSLYGGQFTLSTPLINQIFVYLLWIGFHNINVLNDFVDTLFSIRVAIVKTL